jgi:pimeloyl-ACP methyl ester carboxylesterase
MPTGRGLGLASAARLAIAATTACGFIGCASPLHRAERIAARGDLRPLVIDGAGLHHRAFARSGSAREPLVIFIEGDGSPWVDGGIRVATDPTPHSPLALELAAATPGPVLYLGRPCYFDFVSEKGCSGASWTSQRYCAELVGSMTAAATRYATGHGFKQVLLVGYSGGGTIAALMARDMPAVVGLVTVAGNLDPDTWARLHGYLPLSGRNPALEPALPMKLLQLHLVGGRDRNVPYAAASAYLQHLAPKDVMQFEDFDHACCWTRVWPAVYARMRARLAPDVSTASAN